VGVGGPQSNEEECIESIQSLAFELTHHLRGRTGTLMLKVDNEVDNYARATLCAY
jgi:hypothetical protein